MITLRRQWSRALTAARRPSRRSLLGLTAGVAAAALALTPAGAAVLPIVGGYYIQTNGANAAIGLGDYYSATSGGNQDHLLRINIPCSWPSGKPVYVDLFGAEMTSFAATNGLSEEPSGALDTSRYTITGPGGATATQDFAPTAVAEAWTRFYTIPDGRAGCGQWNLTDKLLGAADDQNGWKLRVGGDNDADPTNAPPADYDNPDGIAGTDDEIVMGLERTTFQHDAGATICQTFYSYVAPGLASAKFHNFDMDGNGRVRYYAPGQTVDPTGNVGGTAGTVSANAAWNGSAGTTRVGNTIASPTPGWWTIVSCISNHNQLIQEGVNSGLLYMKQPGAPSLTVTKSDGVSTVSAGDSVSYAVTVKNTSDVAPSPGAATHVVATDTLPSGMTFGSCSWTAPAVGTCSESGGVVTASLTGALDAGGTAVVTVNGSWPTSATAGSKTNSVSVAYEDSYGDTFSPVSGSDTDTLVRPTDVYVTDAFDSPFYAGQPNAVTVHVGNEGIVAAANVQVVGTIASGFAVTGFTAPAGWSCSWSTPTFTCDLTGSLAVGDTADLRVLGTVTAAPDTDVTVPVDVTTSTLELDTSDNHYSVTKKTTAFPADVRVADAIESTFYAGRPNALVVTVGSEGLDDAAGVQVTGPIPSGFDVTGFDAPAGWSCSATVSDWTCTRSGIFATGAPDEVIRVLGTVTAAPSTDVTFPVSVSTTTLELDLADNTDSVKDTTVPFPADVYVSDTIESTFDAGQPNALVVTVGSEGLDGAAGVQVTGPIPSGFDVTVFDAPAGWTCANTVSDWTCTRSGIFATGAPDEVIRVLGTVTAAPGDDVTFPVDVSTTTLELDLSDNHDSVTGSALAYPADVTVTTTLEGPLSHGDPGVLVVTVGSEGLDGADGVTVGGPLPDGFDFTGFDAPAGWLCSAQTVVDPKTWQCARAGTFATGAPDEVIRVLGDVTATGGDTVAFSADVATTTLELDLSDNHDSVSGTVRGLDLSAVPVCDKDVPWLQLDITPIAFTPAPGATATVVWRNSAGDVVRTDTNVDLSQRLLWPGAAVDGAGNPTDWPGWTDASGSWVTEDDGLLPDLTIEVSVNPKATTTVTYPAATADCAARPTVAPVDGGDIGGGGGGGGGGTTGGTGGHDTGGTTPDQAADAPGVAATTGGLAETGINLAVNLLLAGLLIGGGVVIRRAARPRRQAS